MSWSARVAGRPAEALERFTAAAKASWGYTHSEGDKGNIDWAIASLADRIKFFAGNEVPTTIVELEGSGHFDDASGQGNVTITFKVLADRRRS